MWENNGLESHLLLVLENVQMKQIKSWPTQQHKPVCFSRKGLRKASGVG